jgi:hypothetical protein
MVRHRPLGTSVQYAPTSTAVAMAMGLEGWDQPCQRPMKVTP